MTESSILASTRGARRSKSPYLLASTDRAHLGSVQKMEAHLPYHVFSRVHDDDDDLQDSLVK